MYAYPNDAHKLRAVRVRTCNEESVHRSLPGYSNAAIHTLSPNNACRVQSVVMVVTAGVIEAKVLKSLIKVRVVGVAASDPDHVDGNILYTLRWETGSPKMLAIRLSRY